MFCEKCGAQVEAGVKFCPTCGNPMPAVEQPVQEPVYNQSYNQTYNQTYTTEAVKPKVNSTPFLVWSIINLVCCCMPLGIAGLVFAIKAGSATTQEDADKAIKLAKTLNLVGTILGAVVAVLYVVLMAMGIFSSNEFMGY